MKKQKNLEENILENNFLKIILDYNKVKINTKGAGSIGFEIEKLIFLDIKDKNNGSKSSYEIVPKEAAYRINIYKMYKKGKEQTSHIYLDKVGKIIKTG